MPKLAKETFIWLKQGMSPLAKLAKHILVPVLA